MKNLLYKEFALSIHPLFFLVPLLGALVLIPNWPYFIAMMYFMFISVPNIFMTGRAQNDITFSVLLPVRKRDVVGARVMSVVILELLSVAVTVVFAFVNAALYEKGNDLLDANVAFFGLTLIMYGLFNVIFLPMFYKTAYKLGLPLIASITVAVVYAFVVESVIQAVPAAAVLDGRTPTPAQWVTLAVGIIFYALTTFAAYRASARRFAHIDL
jgi:small-conductance mechanosensitive channel